VRAVVLAGLAGGLAAETNGILAASDAIDAGAVPVPSWIGLVAGASLYLASLILGLPALRARGRAGGDDTG
jgi:hypothetical protein